MDYLRSCYRTHIKPFPDSDLVVPIVWYRAAQGARVYTPSTPFRSSTWELPDGQPRPFPTGEIGPRTWYSGYNWLKLEGKGEVCGLAEVWDGNGSIAHYQPIVREPDGASECCIREPIMTGGGSGGGIFLWGATFPWSGGGGGGGGLVPALASPFTGGGGGGGSFAVVSSQVWDGGGAGGGSFPVDAVFPSSGGGAGGGDGFTVPPVVTGCCFADPTPRFLRLRVEADDCDCFNDQVEDFIYSPDILSWICNLLPWNPGECSGHQLFSMTCAGGWRMAATGCINQIGVLATVSTCEPFSAEFTLPVGSVPCPGCTGVVKVIVFAP